MNKKIIMKRNGALSKDNSKIYMILNNSGQCNQRKNIKNKMNSIHSNQKFSKKVYKFPKHCNSSHLKD
jgi:hypothetical protein